MKVKVNNINKKITNTYNLNFQKPFFKNKNEIKNRMLHEFLSTYFFKHG